MRFRLARWVMKYRAGVGIAFILITLASVSGFPNVEILTIFNDLLRSTIHLCRYFLITAISVIR